MCAGPVGAVAQISRYVATAAAASITILEWDPKSDSLRPVGIYEASQYVVTMSVVKTFLVLGDVMNSVQFLMWRDEDRSINQLAKDYEPTQVYATVFLVDQPSLGIVVGDSSGNIKILRYAPQLLASRGGHRLVCDADFHIGAPVGAFGPQRLRNNKLNAPRFGAAVGGLDGSVALLAPLEERAFRRLYALQGVMCNALEHGAGVNPRGARLFRSQLPAAAAAEGGRMKGVLDGALLWRFVSLPAQVQCELTRAIGTTVDAVLLSLLDVDAQAGML
ncbi:Cleavage/polyadenylation specificity factor, A subunit [Tribonema minus]|uniref:Cleavage/polyadenylation specificity factor, A subunit n=1 Tax=Tribonema minus TaxID=303371 RepID=A0A835Z873_9STRA|nr:Cleavage/polyadenylation specificity factor, A subunit [Tribonema minus]